MIREGVAGGSASAPLDPAHLRQRQTTVVDLLRISVSSIQHAGNLRCRQSGLFVNGSFDVIKKHGSAPVGLRLTRRLLTHQSSSPTSGFKGMSRFKRGGPKIQ